MGYTTEFTGHVTVDPPLNSDEITYLRAFANSRRFQRASGPYATESDEYRGPDTVDYNRHAPEQPGLWCDWEPTDDGTGIEWNGTEKFYDSARWMTYLIDTFLKSGAVVEVETNNPIAGRHYPDAFYRFTFDHVVNGRIEAQGERDDDRWALIVTDNEVAVEHYPTMAERMESNPDLSAAVERLKQAGVTVSQFAALTGQEY